MSLPDAGATCPHCVKPIVPPPARSRKCPHCRASIVVRRGSLLTEADAAKYDEELAVERANLRKFRAAELYKEIRGYSRQSLMRAKKSGVVSGAKVLLSGNECGLCKELKGKVLPIRECTLDALPPFKDCEYEEGCRATWVSVPAPKYKPKW